jgi:radical SAM superfamily enzyme YgiQ (UPF0313 family)
MRVTLIRPSMSPHKAKDAMEPLAMAILASFKPFENLEYKFYDFRIEDIPFDEPTDLVAITVETYTAQCAYKIAAEYKKRNVKVVLGGYHPTFLPEEGLLHADAIVAGDAEECWPKLLCDFRDGKLQKIYKSLNSTCLKGIMPDRSIFNGKKYAPIHLIQFGRGCKYNCDFCSIKTFYGDYLAQRPVEDIVKEISGLKHKHLFIVDDNIFSYKEKTKELFKALIPLKVKWSSQVSIDITDDLELMKLMAESGCISVVIGFESLNKNSLREMRKGWNLSNRTYEQAVKILREHGIMIYGTFVHGYDTDTIDSFKYNLEFALESKFFLANFNPLTPTPGTSLYDRLKKQNRLIRDPWWLDPNYKWGHSQIIPALMTPDELTEGCFWARKTFTEYSNITKRFFNGTAHMTTPYHIGAFLAANIVLRSEVRNKHGTTLAKI